jgi:uncharacterized protein YfaS (alpha-2-macroglobulin family)
LAQGVWNVPSDTDPPENLFITDTLPSGFDVKNSPADKDTGKAKVVGAEGFSIVTASRTPLVVMVAATEKLSGEP